MTYFVRSTALTNYVRVAHELGIDPHKHLNKAGIRRAALLDPTTMIPADALRSLLTASAKSAGIEDFGLRMAETRQLTDLGPLGFAIQGAPTLRKALESMIRYLRLQSETVVMVIEEVDELLVIRESLLIEGSMAQRQSIELVVGGVFRLLKRSLGDAWKPRSICFSHSAPKGPTRHAHVFGMPVLFDQEFDGIVCRAVDLEAPLAAYDPLMASEVQAHLDSLMENAHLSFAEAVRRLVLSMLPSGTCSIDNVAQHLGMDRRTVHRKLLREGETYSAIYDGVRSGLAIRLVESKHRSLAEMATQVGFSSASAFARWFCGRFGCTTTQWQAQRAAEPIRKNSEASG
jgi:AraC-like DNA-binding protein